MKILAIFTSILFLVTTSSVAQIRYAIEHPVSMGFVLLNFAMAFCIYMIIMNSKNIRIPKNFRIKLLNTLSLRRNHKQYFKVS